MSAAVQPKPDPARPGGVLRNDAAAKSGLNKGWYGLEVALRSKARYTGTASHKINPAYTSQTCPEPACGKSRKGQAIFSCPSCGHTERWNDPPTGHNHVVRDPGAPGKVDATANLLGRGPRAGERHP